MDGPGACSRTKGGLTERKGQERSQARQQACKGKALTSYCRKMQRTADAPFESSQSQFWVPSVPMSAPSISSPPTCVTVTRLALLPRPFTFLLSPAASAALAASVTTGTTVALSEGGPTASRKLRCDEWRDS